MDTWFLKDTRGNVVGPLSREVAVDLLRSRPGVFMFTSRDGGVWQPVRTQAVSSLVSAEVPSARRAREEQEAQRAALELDRLRELQPHALFGVPRTATFKEHRKGFLEIAKRYHPGRLPNDVAPSLLRANMAVYQYLTEVLLDLEAKLGDAPAPALSPVAPVPPARASAPPPPPRPSSPRPAAQPAWQLDALHLRQDQDRLKGTLTVTRETAFVFSAHRLMNLTNESVFFPCQPSLALGTRLELLFRFPEASRDVVSPGAVAWENSQPGGVLRGFGVRLSLRTEEKGFMLREAHRLQQPVAR